MPGYSDTDFIYTTDGVRAVAAGVSANPTLLVEIAWDVNPNNGTTPTWGTSSYDVTSRVLAIKTSRGRTYELGRMEAGQAIIRLANEDGAFDPLNASSSHYPNVVPFRPMRVSMVISGITIPIFTGFIERWTQDYIAPNRSETEIVCLDALGMLSQAAVPTLILADALNGNALQYYSLGEENGSAASGNQSAYSWDSLNIVPAKAGVGAGTFAFGDDTAAVLGGGNPACVYFKPDATSGFYNLGYYLQSTLAFTGWRSINDALTVDIWVNHPDTATQSRSIWQMVDRNGQIMASCKMGVGGVITVSLTYQDNTGAWQSNTVSSTNDIRGDGWTFISVSVVQSTGAGTGGLNSATTNTTLYVRNAFGTETVTANNKQVYCGFNGQTLNVAGPDTSLWAGYLAHLTIYGSDKSSTVSNRFDSGLGYLGQDSVTQAVYFITKSGFTQFPRETPLLSGISLMQAMSYGYGKAVTEALQMCIDSEGGVFFVKGDGSIAIRNRHDRIEKQLSTAVTFGENYSGGEIPYLGNVKLDYDPTYIYNYVTIAQNEGSTINAVDFPSTAKYFGRTFQRTSYIQGFDAAGNVSTHAAVLDLSDAANSLVARYKDPHARPPIINVFVTPLVDRHSDILNLEISNRVVWKKRPIRPGAGVLQVTSFVERIEHDINPQEGTWYASFALSPAWGQDYGILGNTTLGKLDSTLVLSY